MTKKQAIAAAFLFVFLALGGLVWQKRTGATAFAIGAPEGRAGKIVFESASSGWPCWPTCDLYSVNANGTNLLTLTKDGHSHDASWSPDGRHILFVHDTYWPGGVQKLGIRVDKPYESHFSIQLYTMDADGGDPHLLRQVEGSIMDAVWSPNGTQLALSYNPMSRREKHSNKGQFPYGAYLLAESGKGKLRLVFPGAEMVAWSPDGKKLAFGTRDPSTGEYAIGVSTVNGSRKVHFVHLPAATGIFPARQLTFPLWPAWSPDGKQIAFSAYFNTEKGSQQQQIFVIRTDGSQLRQATGDPGWQCEHPSWSPDGAELVFSCHMGLPWCCAGGSAGGVLAPGTPRPRCVSKIFALRMNDPNAEPAQVTPFEGEDPKFDPVP